MKIINEIYQILFISSIIFIIKIITNLSIKVYGRFKLKKETRFTLTNIEKLILWVSLTIFLSYIF